MLCFDRSAAEWQWTVYSTKMVTALCMWWSFWCFHIIKVHDQWTECMCVYVLCEWTVCSSARLKCSCVCVCNGRFTNTLRIVSFFKVAAKCFLFKKNQRCSRVCCMCISFLIFISQPALRSVTFHTNSQSSVPSNKSRSSLASVQNNNIVPFNKFKSILN